jgi:hypothetical protein
MDGFKKEIREDRAGAGYHPLGMPVSKNPFSFRRGRFNGLSLYGKGNVAPIFPLRNSGGTLLNSL